MNVFLDRSSLAPRNAVYLKVEKGKKVSEEKKKRKIIIFIKGVKENPMLSYGE